MKIFIYELKKVILKKVFLVILPLCLVINVFLLYASQDTDANRLRITFSEEYSEMLEVYSSMTVAEAKKEIDSELLVYEILDTLDNFAKADSEELIEEYISDIENYRKNNPLAYGKAVLMSERGNESIWKNSFYYDFLKQIEHISAYQNFISEMYNRAEEQSVSSIFGDEQSFSYKNLYKTAKDYESLKNTNLNLVNAKPIIETVQYDLTDVFLIAIILVICFYLFGYEREKGLRFLIRCTKSGRLKTIISKFAVLFVLSVSVTLLFVLSNYQMNSFLYGKANLDINIQSIAEFGNCTFNVNILEFFLLFIVAKMIGALLISALFALIYICCSNSVVIYIVGLGTLGIEFLLYRLISKNSFLNLLKYMNVFYVFDGEELFGEYLNLNIFSNAVNAVSVVLGVFSFLFISCVILSCAFFCKCNYQKNSNLFLVIFEKFKLIFFRINGSTSVFKGEIFKFFIQNRMVILIILLVAYAIISSLGTVSYQFSDFSDVYYKQYMEYLEGDITAQKESYITEQQKYFDDLRHRQNEIAENIELSQNTKQAMIKSIDNILNSKGVAFERVKEQYIRLLDLKDGGINARFIDENVYSSFVSNSTREWNSFIIHFFILLIAVPGIFTIEYKNGMIKLITSTKNGKLQLFIKKNVILIVFTVMSFVAVYIPFLLRFVCTYGTKSFETPIICIFNDLTNSCFSVIGAKICELFYSLLFSFVVVSIISMISIITEKTIFTMAISTIIIIIPCFAVYSIEKLRIGYCIAEGYMLPMIVAFVISVALIFVVIRLSEIRFSKSRIWRKSNADF